VTALEPFALLSAMVLEDGRRWGEVAAAFQREDAAAVLDMAGPRRHFLTRPRGGSKTTDVAAVALAALLTQLPDRSRSLVYAADKDQAGLLLDALGGLASRTPGIGGAVQIGSWSVTNKATAATLTVEPADAAGAFGHRAPLTITDELAQWPTTRGARRLWEAAVSGLPKRADSRLVAITSAGDPAHWSHKVLVQARDSDRWRTSELPGPLPWISESDLAEQRGMLLDSAFARLHLNLWAAGEDRLVRHDDLMACVAHDGPLMAVPGRRYVHGLDIGLKNDRTVLSVCHSEPDPDDGPPAVVLDRMHVLQGTRAQPVQLSDVEAVVIEALREYPGRVRLDPWQAVGLAQRLRAKGHRIEEWPFSAQSVGRLASTLHLLLRDRRLRLPDDAGLIEELANVRLREGSTPGRVRLDHDSGGHDDRAVSLGLAALALVEKAPAGKTRPVSLSQYRRTVVQPTVAGR
jgi:phage terminase large subunit-like protein